MVGTFQHGIHNQRTRIGLPTNFEWNLSSTLFMFLVST